MAQLERALVVGHATHKAGGSVAVSRCWITLRSASIIPVTPSPASARVTSAGLLRQNHLRTNRKTYGSLPR